MRFFQSFSQYFFLLVSYWYHVCKSISFLGNKIIILYLQVTDPYITIKKHYDTSRFPYLIFPLFVSKDNDVSAYRRERLSPNKPQLTVENQQKSCIIALFRVRLRQLTIIVLFAINFLVLQWGMSPDPVTKPVALMQWWPCNDLTMAGLWGDFVTGCMLWHSL